MAQFQFEWSVDGLLGTILEKAEQVIEADSFTEAAGIFESLHGPVGRSNQDGSTLVIHRVEEIE